MHIRKATAADIPAIAQIFDDIHTAEEAGKVTIGWVRDVYPTRATAEAALERGDLFVQEDEGSIVGTAIINQLQADGYEKGNWQFPAPDDQIMVLHTLVISPKAAGRGCGTQFVAFYEAYARSHRCLCLRMDTNERNRRARDLYRKLGYREIGVIPTVFNRIEGVSLVLLEKHLE